MITAAQQDYIERHAHIPEHVPRYVIPVSEVEPHLFANYLVYAKRGFCVFIGYPLGEDFAEERLSSALTEAVKRLRPDVVSLIAPAIPASLGQGPHPSRDHYYRLDLAALTISQKVRNMLSRAERELTVRRHRHFSGEHRRLVETFLEERPADEAVRHIFGRIEAYLASSPGASLFEARNRQGDLVAFDIAEFTPRDYAVYMFNFRSHSSYVPGASDLLLAAVMEQAAAEGKRYLNLGLGINPGIAFFKKKWGGVAFLPYAYCLYRPARRGFFEALLRQLQGM